MGAPHPVTALRPRPGPHADADVVAYAKAEYTMHPTSVPQSRRDTCTQLAEWHWGTGDSTDAVALVVTELVANAVKHARPRRSDHRILLRLAVLADGDLIVEVSDPVAAFPRFDESVRPQPDDEAGRGLVLVRSCSVDLTWFPRPHVGKTVRAHLLANAPTGS